MKPYTNYSTNLIRAERILEYSKPLFRLSPTVHVVWQLQDACQAGVAMSS